MRFFLSRFKFILWNRTGLLLVLAAFYYNAYAWDRAFDWGDEGYFYYVAFAFSKGQKLYDDIQVYNYLPGMFLLFQGIFKVFGTGIVQGRWFLMTCMILVPVLFYRTACRFVSSRLAFWIAMILLLVPGPWDRAYIALLNLCLLTGATLMLGDSPRRGGILFGLVLGIAMTTRIDAAYGGCILLATIIGLRQWQQGPTTQNTPVGSRPGPTSTTQNAPSPQKMGSWLGPTLGALLMGGLPVWTVLATQGILDDYFRQLFGFVGGMTHRLQVPGRLMPPSLAFLSTWDEAGLMIWIFYLSFVPFLLLFWETLRNIWLNWHRSSATASRYHTAIWILLSVWCLLQIPQYAWERPDLHHLTQRAFAFMMALAVVLQTSWQHIATRGFCAGLPSRMASFVLIGYALFYPLKHLYFGQADTGFVHFLGRHMTWQSLPNGISYPSLLQPGQSAQTPDAILAHIIQHTTPQDRVATLPFGPGVNFVTQRLMPGRHLFLFPEIMRPGVEETVIADLRQATTRFVVLFPNWNIHGNLTSLPDYFMPRIMAYLAHDEVVLATPGILLLRSPTAFDQ